MQAPPPQRPAYAPRRSPGSESSNAPAVRSASPAPIQGPAHDKGLGPSVVQPRSSVTSSRSATSLSSRRPTNTPPASHGSGATSITLSQIEKSVTHLLVATKQLLEALTQWSRGQATEAQVSDVYVKLGYEFNMACRAFAAINVDTSDLGNVPEMLRHVLEATLSQEANVESLEKYLPGIRDIIINLLHGLKRKQQKLRQRQAKELREPGPPGAVTGSKRTGSAGSSGSNASGLTSMLEDGVDLSSRQQDLNGHGASPSRRLNAMRDQSHGSFASEQSSLSSTTMQNIPVLPPYLSDENSLRQTADSGFNVEDFPPPPPQPGSKPQSALAALQKGGDLERRASRRYSQYQISRHLGATPNGVPMLAPQHTPMPSQGRGEVKESMRAVQGRESTRQNRETATRGPRGVGVDPSPVRIPSRVLEEEPASSVAQSSGPEVPTPEGRYPTPSATMRGPHSDSFPVTVMLDDPSKKRLGLDPVDSTNSRTPLGPSTTKQVSTAKGRSSPSTPASSQQPAVSLPPKELTLFLQYKSKVKKLVLPEGYSELSVGRLQLAFIDKFSWNTQNNGVDLPEIYIQDQVSGARYELEELSDIKDRTVLVLNVEALDEVKRHIDDGIASLAQIVKVVKQNVDEHASTLQQISERQQDAAKELAKLAAAPPVIAPPIDSILVRRGETTALPATSSTENALSARRINLSHVTELQSLRRDLAVVRQTFTNFQSDIQGSMTTLRKKASNIKVAAAKTSAPDLAGKAGHTYVDQGRSQLNSDSDRLVAKVDDLQDMIEDLRKDVVHRGVRPLPRQLEVASRDISVLTKELRGMDDYIRREKPVWTRIWENELEDVCQGRDELRLMEDLMVDLKDDLEKASGTFALVEAATKEQMKDTKATGAGPLSSPNPGAGFVGRSLSRGLGSLGNSLNQNAAKEGVLDEVRALQPNPTDRLEAIARAEKLRQRELEDRRGGPLQKELSDFVDEGRLRKSGGVEEVERFRRSKEDRIRREVWERQNGAAAPPSDQSQSHGAVANTAPLHTHHDLGTNTQDVPSPAASPTVDGGDEVSSPSSTDFTSGGETTPVASATATSSPTMVNHSTPSSPSTDNLKVYDVK